MITRTAACHRPGAHSRVGDGRGRVLAMLAVAVGVAVAAVPASPAGRADDSAVSTPVSPIVMADRAACPARPRFNSVIDADGRTSFFYRPQPGQTIAGARSRGTGRVRTLMTTARGRAGLPRVEITTDRMVDASRLP